MFKQSPEGVLISLHVLPQAPKSELIGEHNGALKIKINAPPVDGKANEAIISFFSEILETSKSKIEILRGDKSKGKTLLIRGAQRETVQAKVDSLLKAEKPPKKK